MYARSAVAEVHPSSDNTIPESVRARVVAAHRLVHRLARRVARGTRQPEVADDLTQLGMETVCRLAAVHDPARGRLTTFVYARVRGVMLDAVARERVAANDSTALDAELLDTTASDAPTAEEQLVAATDRAAQLALARARLERLAPLDRQLVEACVMAERPITEVSAELGVGYDWARWRLRKAIAALRGRRA